MKKYRISIIDALVDHRKHKTGAIDSRGEDLHYGDMVKHNGEETWFIAYRYGETVLKMTGTIFNIKLKDWTVVTRLDVFGSASDWLIIGEVGDTLYDSVKHLINEDDR